MYNILKSHVKHLSDTIGERNVWNYQNLQLSKDYIISQIPSLKPFEHSYICDDKEVINLEFTIQGDTDDIIIIGAHYDSLIGTVGANDNASSVALLIELIKMFDNRVHYNKTLKFVFFVNEEPPFFMTHNQGSFQYLQYCKDNQYNIKGCIVMDCVGCYSGKQNYPVIDMEFSYPEEGNFITLIGNECCKSFVDRVYNIFNEVSDFPCQTFTDRHDPILQICNWSDHYWFNEYGSVMITDTALYRYKYYHSKYDTYDRLDYEKMVHVMNGLYNTIKEI